MALGTSLLFLSIFLIPALFYLWLARSEPDMLYPIDFRTSDMPLIPIPPIPTK